MGLDSQVEDLLATFAAQGMRTFDQMSVPEARMVTMAFRDLQGPEVEVENIQDLVIPGPAGRLPIRLYRPRSEGVLPAIVYYHGGGWVVGNIEVVDRPCRTLANLSGCIVVSVEYRLSPETKYPGPLDDCWVALEWLRKNGKQLGIDSNRIIVSGDSAGGNLAAVVALKVRNVSANGLVGQILVYPVIAPLVGYSFQSYTDNGEGYLLTKGAMEWFWDHYLQDNDDIKNPDICPLDETNLSELPPTFIATAEFDPLRDEGEEYAQRLKGAGVRTVIKRYDGMIHGFLWMAGVVDAGMTLLNDMATQAKEMVAR